MSVCFLHSARYGISHRRFDGNTAILKTLHYTVTVTLEDRKELCWRLIDLDVKEKVKCIQKAELAKSIIEKLDTCEDQELLGTIDQLITEKTVGTQLLELYKRSKELSKVKTQYDAGRQLTLSYWTTDYPSFIQINLKDCVYSIKHRPNIGDIEYTRDLRQLLNTCKTKNTCTRLTELLKSFPGMEDCTLTDSLAVDLDLGTVEVDVNYFTGKLQVYINEKFSEDFSEVAASLWIYWDNIKHAVTVDYLKSAFAAVGCRLVPNPLRFSKAYHISIAENTQLELPEAYGFVELDMLIPELCYNWHVFALQVSLHSQFSLSFVHFVNETVENSEPVTERPVEILKDAVGLRAFLSDSVVKAKQMAVLRKIAVMLKEQGEK